MEGTAWDAITLLWGPTLLFFDFWRDHGGGGIIHGGVHVGCSFFAKPYGCYKSHIRHMHITSIHHIDELYNPFFLACLDCPVAACTASLRFFTVWGIILHALLRFRHEINVCVAMTISCVGGYITYVHPRSVCIPLGCSTHVLDGPALHLVDLWVHHVPLALALYYRQGRGNIVQAYLMSIAALYMYLLTNDAQEQYPLRNGDLAIVVFVTSVALYAIISSKK